MSNPSFSVMPHLLRPLYSLEALTTNTAGLLVLFGELVPSGDVLQNNRDLDIKKM